MPRQEILRLRSRALFLSLLIFSASFGADLQQYIFETIDLADGLSQTSIMTIATDKYGFTWFGTEDGLDRFDGLEFKHFRYDPIDPTSLNSSSIVSSLVDRRGDLWIGTSASGINKYDYASESFQRFEPDPADSTSPGKGTVYALLEDHRGYIWIGTGSSGLYRLEPESGVFTPLDKLLSPGDTLADPVVLSLCETHDQQLWIGTAYGVSVLDLNSYQIHAYYSYADKPESLTGNYVARVFETHTDSSYSIWLGTDLGGLDRFDVATGTFVHHGYRSRINPGFPDTDVLSMLQVSPDRLWVGTDSRGILIMDTQGVIIDRIQRKSYDDISLKDDIIHSLHDDGEIIWVGSLGGGVSKYFRNRKQFYNLLFDPLEPQGLHDNRILRIHGNSRGHLWIATWSKGLSLYDPETGKFQSYLHQEDDPTSLGSDDIQDIWVDRQDNLWVITERPYIELLRAGATQFERIQGRADPSNGFNSDYPICFYEDHEGFIWIGTWGEGLVRLDPRDMSFQTYTAPSVNEINLANISIYVMFEDSRGMLWLGAESEGLVGFDRETNELIQYKSAPGDPHTLSNNDVMYIHEDAAGVLWLGTYGGGLTRFDPLTRTFNNFSGHLGMRSDVIYAIFEDADGKLWMSTNNGLSRFNKETRTFQNYGISDGVLSQEFNPAGYQARNGILYFGGVRGITYFDPLSIRENQHIPEVCFTQLSIMNHPLGIGEVLNDRIIQEKSLIFEPEIVLGPEDLIFNIKFVSLDYAHPSNNQFAYKLEGFDREWLFNGNQRDVTFTNLPPGHYVLRVKGSNNDGVWNENSANMKILITPAFYETWWFRGSVILLLIAGIVTFFHLRTGFLRRRSEELRQHNIKLNAEIDSRREAHRIARERADYFKAVISQSPVPMAIHNLDGNITHLNNGWVELWGATGPEEIIRDYQVETDILAHKLDLGTKFKEALSGRIVEQSDLIYADAQDRTRVVHLLLYPLRNEAGITNQVMVSIDDVSEIYHQRQLLEKSLHEKEILLREVHHRVKNNLQIIASLLGLQKAGVKDEHISIVLEDFRSRVNSMALVHDALYRSPDFDEIDISSYIHGLLADLKNAFEGDPRIQIMSDIPSIALPVDLAVPCGLIINELVTNALKYGFHDMPVMGGEIRVTFRELPDQRLRMEIQDNGSGLPEPVVWDSVESLGLYLVKILGEQQLMGRVNLDNSQGAHFTIEFPLYPNYDE